MSLINLAKLAVAVIFFVVAYFAYRDIRGKTVIRSGDNKFFNEIKNGIDFHDYFSSWRLIILAILGGIVFMSWAF